MIGVWKIAIGGTVFAALSLIPIPYCACPSWDVWVTDGSGHPVEGALVRLDYQNYSVEEDSHEEDRYTDARGYAMFPRRDSSASALTRCIYSALSATTGVHASFGPHASVMAFARNGYQGYPVSGRFVTDWRGKPEHMESKVAVAPLQL
jgi:hypothetical protein